METIIQVRFEWRKQLPAEEPSIFIIGIGQDMLVLDWDHLQECFYCSKYVVPGTYDNVKLIIGENGKVYNVFPLNISQNSNQIIDLNISKVSSLAISSVFSDYTANGFHSNIPDNTSLHHLSSDSLPSNSANDFSSSIIINEDTIKNSEDSSSNEVLSDRVEAKFYTYFDDNLNGLSMQDLKYKCRQLLIDNKHLMKMSHGAQNAASLSGDVHNKMLVIKKDNIDKFGYKETKSDSLDEIDWLRKQLNVANYKLKMEKEKKEKMLHLATKNINEIKSNRVLILEDENNLSGNNSAKEEIRFTEKCIKSPPLMNKVPFSIGNFGYKAEESEKHLKIFRKVLDESFATIFDHHLRLLNSFGIEYQDSLLLKIKKITDILEYERQITCQKDSCVSLIYTSTPDFDIKCEYCISRVVIIQRLQQENDDLNLRNKQIKEELDKRTLSTVRYKKQRDDARIELRDNMS